MGLELDMVVLRSSPEVISALAETLVEAVASGASVSFMHPLAREVAVAFWTKSLAAAEAGGYAVYPKRGQAWTPSAGSSV